MNKEDYIELLKQERKLLIKEYNFVKLYDTYSNNEILHKISEDIVGKTRMIEFAKLTK